MVVVQGNTLCAQEAGFACAHREAVCVHKEKIICV
jgi:hypothetical protein